MNEPPSAPTNRDVLGLRHRLDLEIYPQLRRSHKVWVIKDPISLRYFQLRAEEFAILEWMDGRSSFAEIKQRFDRRFAPRHITAPRLHQFVAGLHRSGLVTADTEGQGEQLLLRHRSKRASERLATLSNPLAIRFRGFDPGEFLNWLYPKTSWMFSRAFAFAYVAILFAAGVLLVSNWNSLVSRLPQVETLIAPSNWIYLAIALALTKVIHELGHALTCRHYGARCHEMGIMLLLFTPCLYCNVTDAWKLPSRWNRVAIGAAGILVEIGLAALGLIVWWTTQPGLLNSLALNVTVVCSIGTVFLNGNPLLRYDGYYILSDALDLTNLWQDSRSVMNRLASRLTLGLDPGTPPSVRERPVLLLLYGLASATYRVFVLASILYLAYRFCEPRGLGFIADLLAASVIVGLAAKPLNALWNTMRNPVLRRNLRPTRLAGTILAAGLLCVAAAVVPLPCRVRGPVLIEPRDAQRIYVSVPGELVSNVVPGTAVAKGQVLGTLSNMEIQRELESVRSEVERQTLRIRSLRALRGQRQDIAAQLPAANEILNDLQKRLSQLQQDQSELTLTSPTDGVVLEPPAVTDEGANAGDEVASLPKWSGSPMDAANLGCHLERKTLYCLVGQNNAFEASVFINQSDVRYVSEDQPVKLLLDCGQGKVIHGRVSEVSQVSIRSVPGSLAADQRIPTEPLSGKSAPQDTAYKAQVSFDSGDLAMIVGVRGKAKIIIERQSLLRQLHRFLSKTFRPVI